LENKFQYRTATRTLGCKKEEALDAFSRFFKIKAICFILGVDSFLPEMYERETILIISRINNK
jgi:hypothetical protein